MVTAIGMLDPVDDDAEANMTSSASVDASATDTDGQGTKSRKRSGSAHERKSGGPDHVKREVVRESDTQAGLTFTIFRDPQGMYRWTLNDHAGRSLGASQFGFAVFAGALQDVELERSDDRYAHAKVRDDTDA
jgi:hypothetical protein